MELIGAGAQARVYREGDLAVKAFAPDCPASAIYFEAALTAAAAQCGLPVAAPRGVQRREGGDVLLMDYVAGVNLNDWMRAHPDHLEEGFARLVALQRRIHAQHPYLPVRQRDRLGDQIRGSALLDPVRRARLLAQLDALPDGDALCHGDYHGGNVLMQGERLTVIDWPNATIGCPEGDACRSYLLYRLVDEGLGEGYLTAYCRSAGVSAAAVLRWLPVSAAARLSDAQGERDKLFAWMDSTTG
ncbi:MAG: phosphotransferase family protein [Christensenellales bacterium]|jgi:aminoglycoside phosphotransferase (APT) family kinase protein